MVGFGEEVTVANGAPPHADRSAVPDPDVVRVVVADGDPLARRVIGTELGRWPEFVIVGETGDGSALVPLVAELRPEILLLELEMPGLRGPDTIRRILAAAPATKVFVFTILPTDAEEAVAALGAGASGFLSKEAGVERASEWLRRVHRGEAAIPASTTLRVIELLREAPVGGMGLRPVQSELTTREWEVLDYMAQGDSTRELAERLYVSEDTIYSHAKNIMRKLHVHSRAEAIRVAASQSAAGRVA